MKNLLDYKGFKSFIKSKWWPMAFQIPMVIGFGLIIEQLIFGPADIENNFGSALTWVLWWSFLPILFFVFGRLWCAVCPFATISDVLQKYIGAKKPIPSFLRKYGLWIIDIFLIFVIWVDHIYGIVESPRGSGYYLLAIFGGVIVVSLIYERRAWCRYLCPIGGLSGNYARTGMLELRTDQSKCSKCTTQSCYKGTEKAPGCPVFEFPKTMDSMASCNLCGHCVKNCPNDSIRISPRIPTSEFWLIRKPKLSESFLAAVVMGFVFIQNITMLDIWNTILKSLESTLGTTNYSITFTVAYIIAMLIPITILMLTSYFASVFSKEKVFATFTRFGYAIIPLDLGAHLAHNLLHLLNEGETLITTFYTFIGMGAAGGMASIDSGGMGLISLETIKIMQYIILIIGFSGSAYCVNRIAQNKPESNSLVIKIMFIIVLLIFSLINFWLFSLPMMPRM